MQLTLEVFDASLHQDRATMFGSFYSWFTSILPTNKRVTVCSFTTCSTGNNAAYKLFKSRAGPLIGFGINKKLNMRAFT